MRRSSSRSTSQTSERSEGKHTRFRLDSAEAGGSGSEDVAQATAVLHVRASRTAKGKQPFGNRKGADSKPPGLAIRT